jgi:hypothetical protein
MTDNLAKYLDAINILWYKGYDFRQGDAYNRVISQIYPAERDRMNGIAPPSAGGKVQTIDLSGEYNSPLYRHLDYRYLASAPPIPNTVPFYICSGVADMQRDPACLLVGQGEPESALLKVDGKFRSLIFLHSYTAALAGPPAHACTHVGWGEAVVGSYTITYTDGSAETVLLEYSRNIYTSGFPYAFGAYRANPVYQYRALTESVVKRGVSKQLLLKETNYTVLGYEWINPYPIKWIDSVTLWHDSEKSGGVVLFALTGIV